MLLNQLLSDYHNSGGKAWHPNLPLVKTWHAHAHSKPWGFMLGVEIMGVGCDWGSFLYIK